MKKFITKIAIVASLILILDSFKFWPGFMEFFFAGIIPWTNHRIDPSLMLILFSFIAAGLIFKAFVLPHILKSYALKKTHIKLKTTSKLA